MIKLIENNKKIIIFVFFLGFLLLGLKIFKDYGVHWDEYHNQNFGNRWYQFCCDAIFKGSFKPPSLKSDHAWVHGPAFEIFLAFIQKKVLKHNDSRDIIFMRHLCTFLLFYIGVYFFYLLCKLHFKSWKISLLGSLFLILSPRIFAHSFYDTVNIPFLSFYIIGVYTLLRWLDKRTFPMAAIHAFIVAILIDIKAIGITLPLYTIVLLAADISIMFTLKEKARGGKTVLLYLTLLPLFIVLFWPLLWTNTFLNLITAVKLLYSCRWGSTVLYLGRYLTLQSQPWHYGIVWIMISTPILYSFCFCVGCLAIFKSFYKKSITSIFKERNNLLFIAWFLVPLIGGYGRLFDGWRHLYFIYPAFLIFSLTGWIAIWDFIKIKFQKYSYRVIQGLLIFITLLSLARIVYFMVKYHPYQDVYFNLLAGKNKNRRFDLDYWGLSYRKALEYILKNDKDEIVRISVNDYTGKINANILAPTDRKRLVYVESADDADYFLSNYRWHSEEYAYGKEYFSIKVGGAKIMVVYKLK